MYVNNKHEKETYYKFSLKGIEEKYQKKEIRNIQKVIKNIKITNYKTKTYIRDKAGYLIENENEKVKEVERLFEI